MRRHRLLVVLATVALVAPLASSAVAGPPDQRRATVDDTLNAYRIKATAENLSALALAGYDVTEGRDLDRGTVDVVGYGGDLARFDGRQLSSYRAAPARSARPQAAPTDGASDSEWTVWTKYDAVPDDGKEQYTETYDRILADYPDIARKRVTGTTYGGREIVALQITDGATGADIPGRPAVLYNAMQHAREWLAGETCRRSLDYFTSNYGKTTSAGLEVTRLVDTTELWFVCVNNPDGYEFTFTPGNRLWRKNLRDNNVDGVIGPGDGVDPNRNFSDHWGMDAEGSSADPASETYRGPSPASEPETTAMDALFEEIHPVFHKNDHTAAELLLYPQGFQQDTPTADHEIFTALAGDPFKPGIPGFLPELSAGLYITNGDFSGWAYNSEKALAFTPEGTAAEDPSVSGFEYPDSPLQVRQEFQRHLPFVLDLANSSQNPAKPKSHLDNKAQPFVVDSFKESYGAPQPVEAVVKRRLGKVKMHYKIKGKKAKKTKARSFDGGERYNDDPGVYYRRVRGVVKGTEPGDKVKVWFTAGKKESDPFKYRARVETDKRVLVLANEDWSGVQPNPAPLEGPQYLDYYTDALKAAGVEYEVYDVDAHRPASARTPSVCSTTSPTWSGTPATTTCPASRTPRAGPASPSARSRSRTTCVTSSTREASSSTAARTPDGSSPRGTRTTPSRKRRAPTARTATRPASWSRTTSCSTGWAPTPTSPAAASTPRTVRSSRSTAPRRRSTRWTSPSTARTPRPTPTRRRRCW